MSRENVEQLREAYELVNNEFEAFKPGELDALLAFFDPDVVIEYMDAPDPERYEGHGGVRKWFHDFCAVAPPREQAWMPTSTARPALRCRTASRAYSEQIGDMSSRPAPLERD